MSMLKPDYIDIDNDGNTTEPMREQYVIGGIVKAITKFAKKFKGKGDIHTPEFKKYMREKLEKEFPDLSKKELDAIMKDLNKPMGEGFPFEEYAEFSKMPKDIKVFKNEGGLLQDDREQYVVGGVAKLLSKVTQKGVKDYGDIKSKIKNKPKPKERNYDSDSYYTTSEKQELMVDMLVEKGYSPKEIQVLLDDVYKKGNSDKMIKALDLENINEDAYVQSTGFHPYYEAMKVKNRKKNNEGGLLQDDREQYVVGGIIRALSAKAKAKLRKELPKKYNSIVSKEDAKFKEGATTADDIIKEYEMGENVIFYDTLMGNETAISAETIEEILGKNLLTRKKNNEGGPMSIDDQMKAALIIPMEEKEDMSMKSEMPMESDDDMEDNYTRFIMEEALTEEEEDMLMSKLEQDEELAMLFDKVIDVAQEFAGSGPVEGPGSGVSDSIPARLSDGEFVFTAKAVEEIGADNLMAMMKDAEMKADERQGLVTGGPVTDVEEERVVLEPEKAPSQQINITKETVDSPAIARDEEDMIGDDIKKSMLGQSRNI